MWQIRERPPGTIMRAYEEKICNERGTLMRNIRTKMRSRLSLLFIVVAALLAVPAIALADQITNNLDASVDTNAETMALNAGGSDGTTTLYINPANGDGKPGCNMQGDSITVSLASSDTSIATVSPSSITLTGCGSTSGKAITVKPVKAGTATITASGPAAINGGTLTYGQATFTVNVAPPANTAPTVQVTGVVDKSQYEYGSVPKAECSVVDAEDGNKTFDATLNAISGPNSALGLGNQTASCYYKDADGLEASSAATYEIVDTTAPVIAAHDNITAEATGPNGALVSYTAPTANDAVYGSVDVECLPASGSQFGFGDTTVTCTATDGSGNEATPTTFKVTVADTKAPSLTVPSGPVRVEATGPTGAVATYQVSAEDAVDPAPSISCTPESGNVFKLGTTQVTCTAKDATGNTSAEQTFDVIVEDTTAPVIAAHADVNATATGANGALVNYTSPGTTDAVDGNGTATCLPASGTTFAVGPTTVTCNATDAAGNKAASTTFKVNVAYSWSNFLQPINVTGAQSVFKLGSTVPVKFNLTGASAGITDGTFYLKYFYLGAGDGLGEQEAVATTTATTGTEFRYSAGQYIYNWSTKSVSKPGNYELRVYSDSAGTVLLGKVGIEIKK
jgi:hypothetical protein